MVTGGLGWVLCFYDGLAGPTGLEDVRTGPSAPSWSILASGVGDGIAATSFVSSWPAARLPNAFVLFVHISCLTGRETCELRLLALAVLILIQAVRLAMM